MKCEPNIKTKIIKFLEEKASFIKRKASTISSRSGGGQRFLSEDTESILTVMERKIYLPWGVEEDGWIEAHTVCPSHWYTKF